MRGQNEQNVTPGLELGFMLAIGAVTEAVNETELNSYTKQMILAAIGQKLDALKGAGGDER
ncbi:hypothetical protein EFE24_05915 [Weissella cibaria]|nr:hypothetical protein [Weissella cibaria]MCS8564901.1 hypothetical protein [Weissella cibaria]MCS8575400.1 hypothetical protein [Weissella cibaria]